MESYLCMDLLTLDLVNVLEVGPLRTLLREGLNTAVRTAT